MSATTVCDKNLARLLKLSELGGQGGDQEFERSFSSLAHAAIREKAPPLMNYEIGFQVLDRNEENTKAVGALAFRVGQQNLLVPMFFLKGQRKGHELLYLQDQDSFVPLKENWINRVINRKQNRLGTGAQYNVQRLGVRQPDLNQLLFPFGKTSAAVGMISQAWLQSVDEAAEQQIKLAAEVAELLYFPTLLGKMNKQAADAYRKLCCKHPYLWKHALDTYGADAMDAALASANSRLPCHADLLAAAAADGPTEMFVTAEAKPQLEIYAYMSETGTWPKGQVPNNMHDGERIQYIRDKYLIRDARPDEQISELFDAEAANQLTNPTQSGIYQVLLSNGDLVKCAIMLSCQQPAGTLPYAVVVPTEGDDKSMTMAPASRVFVVPNPDDRKEYLEWIRDLPEIGDLPEDKAVLLFTRFGDAVGPFDVYGKSSSDDRTLYTGRYMQSAQYDSEDGWAESRRVTWRTRAENGDEQLYIDPRPGTAIRTARGVVYVPQNSKKLAVNRYGDGLQLGRFEDARRTSMDETRPLKIAKVNENEVMLTGLKQPLQKKEALLRLVRDFGLREKTARDLLLRLPAQGWNLRIKRAAGEYDPEQRRVPAPLPNHQQSDAAGNYMGFNGPTSISVENEQPVAGLGMNNAFPDSMRPNVRDNEIPFNNPTSGGRGGGQAPTEGVDTAVLMSLLRTVGDDSIVDELLPDLLLALDKLGRLIFQFYAHGDVFADRYGKSDMPELEDSLRNTFEDLGDLTLFLLERSAAPYPEEGGEANYDL